MALTISIHREFIPRQFVEAIIRIAVLLNEKSKARPYQSLLKLLNKNVIPHAVQSHTDEFRRELQERDVHDKPPSALLLRALNSHSHDKLKLLCTGARSVQTPSRGTTARLCPLLCLAGMPVLAGL